MSTATNPEKTKHAEVRKKLIEVFSLKLKVSHDLKLGMPIKLCKLDFSKVISSEF